VWQEAKGHPKDGWEGEVHRGGPTRARRESMCLDLKRETEQPDLRVPAPYASPRTSQNSS